MTADFNAGCASSPLGIRRTHSRPGTGRSQQWARRPILPRGLGAESHQQASLRVPGGIACQARPCLFKYINFFDGFLTFRIENDIVLLFENQI